MRVLVLALICLATPPTLAQTEPVQLLDDDGAAAIAATESLLFLGDIFGASDNDTDPRGIEVYEQDNAGQWVFSVLIETGEFEARALDVSDDYIVASNFDPQLRPEPGQRPDEVRIYERTGERSWTLAASITRDDLPEASEFGRTLALSGDRVLIGSPINAGSTSDQPPGRVFVHERNASGDWPETAVIQAPADAPDTAFGSGLDLDGDRAVIKITDTNAYDSDTFVYERQSSTDTWLLVSALERSTFRSVVASPSVVLAGDLLLNVYRTIVGSSDFLGTINVYRRAPGGGWTLTQTLETDSSIGSLSLAGDVLFAGTSNRDVESTRAVGAVFRFGQDEDGAWSPTEVIEPPGGPRPFLFFGSRLAVSSTSLFVDQVGDLAIYRFGAVPPPSHDLPEPWVAADLGAPVAPGSTIYDDATDLATVTASGDIWGPHDRFQFAYRPLVGDGFIAARLTSIAPGNDFALDPWAKAGIMIRSSEDPGSAHAFLLGTPERGLHVQYRTETSAEMESIVAGEASEGGFAPTWLRLTRAGDVLTAETSDDGITWREVAAGVLPLPETALVGLAVTATDLDYVGALATATFTGIDVVETGAHAEEEERSDAFAGTDALTAIGVAAYPNPFTSATTLALDLPLSGAYEVAVYDVLGRVVQQWTLTEQAGASAQVTADLSGEAAGVYVVRARHTESGVTATRRLLRVR
ncbi:MAG: T9SS type A sorting domain-containing protein [Bacteroidota bacterium]